MGDGNQERIAFGRLAGLGVYHLEMKMSSRPMDYSPESLVSPEPRTEKIESFRNCRKDYTLPTYGA